MLESTAAGPVSLAWSAGALTLRAAPTAAARGLYFEGEWCLRSARGACVFGRAALDAAAAPLQLLPATLQLEPLAQPPGSMAVKLKGPAGQVWLGPLHLMERPAGPDAQAPAPPNQPAGAAAG